MSKKSSIYPTTSFIVTQVTSIPGIATFILRLNTFIWYFSVVYIHARIQLPIHFIFKVFWIISIENFTKLRGMQKILLNILELDIVRTVEHSYKLVFLGDEVSLSRLRDDVSEVFMFFITHVMNHFFSFFMLLFG